MSVAAGGNRETVATVSNLLNQRMGVGVTERGYGPQSG
ncbi:hypothetical protein COMA2_120003 [Candidatus Nitrospira nitrificans]|uniref:Uncharacterized protein n=1 Tax=Candidatus Nitrospira nitrificans TaxID=1742973 RepID=A0A0S4LAZ1_9BACT|nr:hypothetical protein COMA2_120003 [Candidatus Nitrospira nitrificans]